MNPQRLGRVVRLLELFYAGTAFSANQLAEIFGCTRRTIFRDLALLRQAGVDVLFDWQESTYFIPAANRRVWTELSPDECQTLVLAVATSPIRHMGAIASDLESAVAKLLVHSREEERTRLARLMDAVVAKNAPLEEESELVLRRVMDALAKRQKIRIRFAGGGVESPLSTAISPRQVVMDEFGWGVVAYSTWHRRTVRLSIKDILSVETMGETYVLQPVPAGWNPAPVAVHGK